MAWEWVSPLATIAVAGIGVTGTWLAGRNQGKVALESARIAAMNTQQASREDRNQKRIDAAYRDLDRNLSAVEALLIRLTPGVAAGEFQDLATLPASYFPPSALEALNADRLYRSWEVERIVEQFHAEIATLEGHFSAVLTQNALPKPDVGLMTVLEASISEHAAAGIDAIERIRARMRAELRGEAGA